MHNNLFFADNYAFQKWESGLVHKGMIPYLVNSKSGSWICIKNRLNQIFGILCLIIGDLLKNVDTLRSPAMIFL